MSGGFLLTGGRPQCYPFPGSRNGFSPFEFHCPSRPHQAHQEQFTGKAVIGRTGFFNAEVLAKNGRCSFGGGRITDIRS
jgi:hypothetical protein